MKYAIRSVAMMVLAGLALPAATTAQDAGTAVVSGGRQNAPGRAGAPGRQTAPRAGLPGRRGDMTPAQLDQAFDRFMAAQARNALQLTADQVAAFGPRLQRLQQARRRAQRQRRLLVQEVNEITRSGALDDQTVTEKLKELDAQAARADAEIGQAYQDLDAVLTPQQRLRFRAFEVRMEQRKLELIARARQAAGARAP